MNISEKLNHVVTRHDELRDLLASTHNLTGQELQVASREFAELADIVTVIQEYKKLENDIRNLTELISDANTENDMKTLAEEELYIVKERLSEVEKKIQLLLLPKDETDEKNVILEIRAGTGGDEAALFVADLYRMYQRYAELKNWKFVPLDVAETGIGGFKEVSVNITGKGVFARLKYESGVHRVQRVPETESQGRVHTSAATVAVLPEAEELDIKVDAKDLRIDTYRAQGAGGQHVNKTDSAIRITHLPTNIVVQCQDGKSQHKNRAQAMKMLRTKLYETEREERDSARARDRKNQVGSGDRSERIRTYNYPQGRLTDHRIDLTLYKLDKTMDGDLDEVTNALLAEDQAAQLGEIS